VNGFRLRTERDQPVPAATDTLLLDWFGGAHRQRSTIAATEFLAGLAPTAAARDLFRLAGAVFCVDKVALRAEAADGWTREVALDAPVRTRATWQVARPALVDALTFLSGDRWTLRFRAGAADVRGETRVRAPDAICLFSGGLDSLAGAINLLEEGRDVMLVGHFDSGFIGGIQQTLGQRLRHFYRDRVRLRQLRLAPAAPNRLQARPLPEERENSTRARSFLFIAAGLVLASSFGDDVPLHLPENGFIGINVPLVGSRAGSLSTRTTHPYFIARFEDALSGVGIANPIVNPFRLKTKGEALAGCRNFDLLESLVDASISCAHPETARWERLPPSNCGYCFPCLIRRAALHRIGLDAGASYRHDALTDAALFAEGSDRGADMRALVRGLARDPHPYDVLRNGAVPAGDAAAFGDVYLRGREEIAAWVLGGAGDELRALLAERASA
jgi:7-cyano-7-deazaguanine synthase in queuosine biosynthesis